MLFRSSPGTKSSFWIRPSRVHSAHITQEVEIHYRWHALYGRKVRKLYAERRSGRNVVVVEAEPGVAIVLAAWMLDPAVCATMSLGPAIVDIVGLTDLHRLLTTLGLRRTCSDEHSPAEEVHHAIAVVSDCFHQATTSALDSAGPSSVERDDQGRPQHRDPPTCSPSDGGRRSGSRGDRR